MLHLSKNQFSPNLFSPISYEYSLSLFTELDWVELNWESGLTCHPLLAKVSEEGEVVLVMSEGAVFIAKGIAI